MTEDEKNDQSMENGAGAEAGVDPSQMSEAEMREALEKQFREQKVSDMLVQYMAGLSHLGYIKMGLTDETGDVKDMAQASLAIDGFKALLDAVKDRLDSQDASALEGALSSMQMTFAQASQGGAGEESGSSADESAPDDETKKDGGDASDRLWVPGKE
jgi:hypothetical protein